jgi:hypothetical protein
MIKKTNKGEITMQILSNTIDTIVESAWRILSQRREALRDAKNDLNACKINLSEFEKREKELNEWDWLLKNNVDNPLAVVSQNVVFIDKDNGLLFKMGNGSLMSSLTEDEMIMERIDTTFGEKYIPDEDYFVGPRCLSYQKFFNSKKFNIVRLAFGESMNKPFQPDFRITRKVI